jgi:MFS family permease
MSATLSTGEYPPTPPSAHWAIRFLYFFFTAGLGIFVPYINVYYLSIGLSGLQIGALGTIGPLIGVFSSIVWSIASDRFGRPRLLFSLALMGTLMAVVLLANAKVFVWLIPAVMLFSLFSSPIPAMLDSTIFRLLGNQPERYGRYRAFGPLGFIAPSALIGFLLKRAGLGALFPAYGLTLLLCLLVSFGLPNTPPHSRT